MEFINTLQGSAMVLITVLFTIMQMISAILDFIISLVDLMTNIIPQCLRAGMGLFISIRLFKFITKRGAGNVRPVASNTGGIQNYMDKLDKEGK